jgi:hypothetical protein
MDAIENLIKYEEGDMSEEEEVGFFQCLINSGLAWQLQGHYGRMAMHLIESGFCTPPTNEE